MTETLAPIVIAIETPAEPDEVWEALTDPDRVAEWFTDASSVGAPGDPYRLDFGDSVVEGRIVRVEPGRAFAHTWAWADGDDVDDETIVTWTVEPRPGGGTIVTLDHDGWSADGANQSSRDDHLGYWTAYLEELEALLAD